MRDASFHLTNTLGGKTELFQPLEPGRVRMYHCGPTVKEHMNVAKFRSYLLADMLRRWFEISGYEVLQVMNITDVGHLTDEVAGVGEDRIEAARV